ncbi:MAG: DUF5686 family protein [Bacteroidales bacterium]|jgi:hypothetical protein|nr:DUF5686 family protein [Bacteroidales bacterium]
MKTKKLVNIIIICIALFFVSAIGYSQEITRVRGKIIDINTKEPLPFVSIVFVGKHIGTITDYNGVYSIETMWASDHIQASFLGYNSQEKEIVLGENQVVDFQLESKSIDLNEIEISAKRIRYRNKDNLAVDLIRKVIDNKDNNRKEKLDNYEYDKYEKVEFDLNNITEKFRNKKALKKFQFVFNYVDTSEINGKPYLPVFLKETVSKIYYRKSPKTQKEYISGTNMVGFHDYIDNEGISFMVDNLYQDIDINENNIILMTNQFISPLSSISPTIYKFHILDTLDVNGYSCINLAFQPRNKLDFAFKGNLYITNDDKYAVIKADMRITEDINLNFVNDLQIVQEFENIDNQCWVLSKDNLIVDFNIGKKGIGMFGKKSIYYKNYLFNQQRNDTVYAGIENAIKEDDYAYRTKEFWKENRFSKLTEQEVGIYTMIDSVQNVPAFKRTMDIVMLLLAGYWNFGNVDLGPVSTFYSFNDVEGFRLRVGGRTSDKFSERLRLEGYLLYGFNDEKYKYSGTATWSLNKKPIKNNPRHTIMAMYQVETNFPGMEMQFINEDNFLLSFKRGVADKILYYKMYKLEHYRDWGSGFSTALNFKHIKQEPGGTLYFNYEDYSVSEIVSSEFSATLRFAPNEKFYQGMNYKTPIITKHPIFHLSYNQGIEGLLNADYSYSKLSFNVFKRFYVSLFGFTNFEFEAAKVFGSGIPFPLLYVHRANQTYSYQLRSYNLMNFLELVSDEYIAVFVEHHFNGFIFNKIPLFKRLKWREIVSFKAINGNLSAKNNPDLTYGLMQFPTDENATPTTFTLKQEPYVELSVGIGNIFKLFRVDIIRRMTYLDNPDVSEYGIRARFKLDF